MEPANNSKLNLHGKLLRNEINSENYQERSLNLINDFKSDLSNCNKFKDALLFHLRSCDGSAVSDLLRYREHVPSLKNYITGYLAFHNGQAKAAFDHLYLYLKETQFEDHDACLTITYCMTRYTGHPAIEEVLELLKSKFPMMVAFYGTCSGQHHLVPQSERDSRVLKWLNVINDMKHGKFQYRYDKDDFFPRIGLIEIIALATKQNYSEEFALWFDKMLHQYPWDSELRTHFIVYLLNNNKPHIGIDQIDIYLSFSHKIPSLPLFQIISLLIDKGYKSLAIHAARYCGDDPIGKALSKYINAVYSDEPRQSLKSFSVEGLDAQTKIKFLALKMRDQKEYCFFDDAVETANQILKLADYSNAFLLKAKCCTQFEAAITAANKAVGLEDNFITRKARVEVIFRFKKDWLVAKKDLSNLLQKRPDDISLKNSYFKVLIECRAYDEAQKVLESFKTDTSQTKKLRALYFLRTKEFSKANDTMIGVEITHDEDRNLLAEIYYNLGKSPEEVYEQFSDVSAVDNTQRIIAYLNTLKALKKDTEAKAFFDKLSADLHPFLGADLVSYLKKIVINPPSKVKVAPPGKAHANKAPTDNFVPEPSKVKQNRAAKNVSQAPHTLLPSAVEPVVKEKPLIERKSTPILPVHVIAEPKMRTIFSNGYMTRVVDANFHLSKLASLLGNNTLDDRTRRYNFIYHMVRAIEILHPTNVESETDEAGIHLFSHRIFNLRILRHFRNDLVHYFNLIDNKQLEAFAIWLIRMDIPSKTLSEKPVLDESHFSLVAKELFDRWMKEDHIKPALQVIKDELAYIPTIFTKALDARDNFTKDGLQINALKVAVMNIGTRISEIKKLNFGMGLWLESVFPEFLFARNTEIAHGINNLDFDAIFEIVRSAQDKLKLMS